MMGEPLLLLVDDDPDDLDVIGAVLHRAFPRSVVRTAGGAGDAMQACDNEAFDCVIMDYNMPGCDGLHCTKSLRAGFPYLPIVLSTGFGDELLAAHAVQSGVTDYLPKSRITSDSMKRAVEHAMRLSDQARVIDEQRGELETFAHALAHDFKQPIRQIRTFSALISDSINHGSTIGLQQHLGFLDNAARRLGDLVDVMSEYTLLNRPPEMMSVDLNLVIGEIRTSLEPLLRERAGVLNADHAPTVRGNATLLEQVLQNLIVNGLKYNKDPAPTLTIAFEIDRSNCIIEVSDNGIGIEAQYLDEIFRPLARLHADSEYQGTGLGLTLARKAVLAQNGSIWCTSAPGVGSTFFVRLPLADPAAV